MNSKLARYLREHPADRLRRDSSPPRSGRVWRIRDRLSEQDIVRLIIAFKLGAPKQVLAEHYGIGLKSVKQILREHGVRKRSRYDELPVA